MLCERGVEECYALTWTIEVQDDMCKLPGTALNKVAIGNSVSFDV